MTIKRSAGATTRPLADRAGRSVALVVLSLAQFLIALDYSIVYVALPSIARDLRLASAQAQWVVSAYAVLFAGFLVVGGRLCDRAGPRRVFVVAVLGFGAASAVGGAATGGAFLVTARAAQGLAASLIQPAVLALIGTTFPAGRQRHRATAVWGAVGASGLAAGVILGGLLTTTSWRLTFLVNVPVTVVCALATLLWLREDRPATADRIPGLAAALGTTTVLGLVLGLTFAAAEGWNSPATLIILTLSVALVMMFLAHEHRSSNVLVDRDLRRKPTLRLGVAATGLYMASVGSEFYLLTLFLQTVRGYSPLAAGYAFLPLAVTVTVGNVVAGRALQHVKVATVLLSGFALAAVGLTWLALALGGHSYLKDLLPGLLLSGLGHGVIYTSMFVIGTSDIPRAQEGMAGALLTTSQYLSGALAIGLLTLVLGGSPDAGSMRSAILVTATAAVAGALAAARATRTAGTRQPTGSRVGTRHATCTDVVTSSNVSQCVIGEM
jgi:EmrB/QacA subfamily drug resistance transporter